MDKPLGVLESIDRNHRKVLLNVLGVPVSFTRAAALALPLNVLGALPLSLLREKDRTAEKIAGRTLGYAAMLYLTNSLHSVGHILGGKAVGAPMDELIVTATRQVNRYEGDQTPYPTTTHLARASGGPLFNFVVAILTYIIYRARQNPQWLADFALINTLIGIGALSPVESADGGSILSALRASRAR